MTNYKDAKYQFPASAITSGDIAVGRLTNAPAETKPVVSSVAPTAITNDAQNIVITGTDFVAIPRVDIINTATGIWYSVNSVTRDSATQLTVNLTLAVDAGTYRIRVENPDGNSGISAASFLTVSDAPVWTTGAGSLGSIAGNFSGTVATVAATGDTVTFSETTSVLTNASLGNCTLNSSTGVITTSDFDGSGTTNRTHTFTLRATDAQGQTADREFTLTADYAKATGGTITTHGSYTYHTFLADGNFVNLTSQNIDYLMVAGGGSGGSYAGGGGAGGLLNASVSSLSVATYAIVVGAGGVNSAGVSTTQAVGDNGDNTTFNSLTAIGGGGGGDGATATAGSGGSGGGGSYQSGAVGTGTVGQGNAGGSSSYGNPFPSGGGGGAGAVGGNASSSTQAGAGGAGSNFSTWATATSTGDGGYYAGGGGGGVSGCGGGYTGGGAGGAAGSGGGGAGGVGGSGQSAGDANTGGGGGAGGYCSGGNYNPQNGGSGIVIIRYLT